MIVFNGFQRERLKGLRALDARQRSTVTVMGAVSGGTTERRSSMSFLDHLKYTVVVLGFDFR